MGEAKCDTMLFQFSIEEFHINQVKLTNIFPHKFKIAQIMVISGYFSNDLVIKELLFALEEKNQGQVPHLHFPRISLPYSPFVRYGQVLFNRNPTSDVYV